MKIKFGSSGDFKNILSWLDKTKSSDAHAMLTKIADEGRVALQAATPIGQTGRTASGWEARVERTPNGAELSYVNNAHIEAGVNVAKILQLGHGTGTGGYVPPINYIPPAMDGIMTKVSDIVEKEIIK